MEKCPQLSINQKIKKYAQMIEIYNVKGPFGISISRMVWNSRPHLTFPRICHFILLYCETVPVFPEGCKLLQRDI